MENLCAPQRNSPIAVQRSLRGSVSSVLKPGRHGGHGAAQPQCQISNSKFKTRACRRVCQKNNKLRSCITEVSERLRVLCVKARQARSTRRPDFDCSLAALPYFVTAGLEGGRLGEELGCEV
jgi:hypothetical protein